MKTKRDLTKEVFRLRDEIYNLQEQLEEERKFNEAIRQATEDKMLPLKGVECTGCKHCFLYVANNRALAIACKKDIDCKDFERSEHVVQKYANVAYGSSNFYVETKDIIANG